MKINHVLWYWKRLFVEWAWPLWHSTICHHTGWKMTREGLESRKSPFMKVLHKLQCKLVCDPLDWAYHGNNTWFRLRERQWKKKQRGES